MNIKSCPFCNSEAELTEDNWENPNAGYGGMYGYKVECLSCLACSPTVSYDYFSRFSKYSVADFNKDTALRSKEEERYKHYVDGIKYETVKKWNKRYEFATYGGECGSLSKVVQD